MDAKNGGEIQVIGCGLPRTGTASLQRALQILGYKPCHHMQTDVLTEPYHRAQRWIEVWDAPDKAARQALIRKIYTSGGYRATVDFPPSLFVDDLIEMYPNAKVVLTLRSSPEVWRQSFNNTLDLTWTPWYLACTFLLPSIQWSILPMGRRWEAMNKRRHNAQIYRTNSTDIYTRHNDWARKLVPKERLLEMQVGDGWAPLCDFLGAKVPDEPYPRANDTKEIRNWFFIGSAVGSVVWVFWAAVCAGLYYYAMSMPRSQSGSREL